MSPLHEAMFINNAKYLAILLEAGADPEIRISRPGDEIDGFNAYQYLEYLERRNKSEYPELKNLLRQSKGEVKN